MNKMSACNTFPLASIRVHVKIDAKCELQIAIGLWNVENEKNKNINFDWLISAGPTAKWNAHRETKRAIWLSADLKINALELPYIFFENALSFEQRTLEAGYEHLELMSVSMRSNYGVGLFT